MLRRGCNSVIVSGHVNRILHHEINEYNPTGTTMSVYLNGERVSVLEDERELDNPEALHHPTWLGSLSEGKQPFPGRFSKPLVLNVSLAGGDPFSPESVHAELCPTTDQTR